jgi:hypothetical protein
VSGAGWDAVTSGGTWVKQNGYWLHWAADVDVARGPVVGDTLERTYYTGDGAPKMTYTPFAQWTYGYTIVNVGGNKTLGSATGLANDATVYSTEIGIRKDNGTFSSTAINVTGSNAQTYASLFSEILTDLQISVPSLYPRGVSIVIESGNIKIINNQPGQYNSSGAVTANIMVDSDAGTNPLFASLTGYVGVEGTVFSGNRVVGHVSTDQNGQYPEDSFTLGLPAPDVVTAGTTLELVANSASVASASRTNPVVVTYLSNYRQLKTGDEVTFSGVGGMTQLNGNRYRVGFSNTHGGTVQIFTLHALNGETLDGTAFGTFTSGGTWTESYANVAEQDRETRSYAITYVTEIGEEGPPSDPIGTLEWSPGKAVSFTNIPDSPAGDYNVKKIRIYRTASGSDSAEFLFDNEIDIGTTTYTDYIKGDSLGEVLPSTLWDAPPSDLTSLIALPNGVLAGVSGNNLCFSYPGQPHAWPATYQKAADYPLIGCGNIGTSVVAIAQNDAYVANGADPANTNLEALKIQQGCQSKRGIVTLGLFGVLYPSADGLVIVRQGGIDIATKEYFTRDEWQDLINPSSIHAYCLDNRYVAFYDNGTTQGGFIFDPAQGDAGLVFIDVYATAGRYDPLSDLLHLMVGDYVEQWDSNTLNNLTYLWKSKKFDSVESVAFSCGEVLADDYNDITLRVYANGVQVHEESVASQEPFRISDYEPGRRHEIEIEGASSVKRIVLAEAFEELV